MTVWRRVLGTLRGLLKGEPARQLGLFDQPVQHPGIRGGRGYFDRWGRWQYGDRPTEFQMVPTGVEPEPPDVAYDQPPNLADYDVILVNTSSGKDSTAALDVTVKAAEAAGVRDRVHAVYCDLGEPDEDKPGVVSKGTRDLCERQVARYGIPFHVVGRDRDLIHQIEHERGKFPGPGQGRFCTSDHKTHQVYKLHTAMADDLRARTGKQQPRILDVLGMRALESDERAAKPEYMHRAVASSGNKHVDQWLPIKWWTKAEVLARNAETGVEVHPIYSKGIPRESCTFCVFAPWEQNVRQGLMNPDLLDEYVRVEAKIGHTFQHKRPIADVKAEVERIKATGEPWPEVPERDERQALARLRREGKWKPPAADDPVGRFLTASWKFEGGDTSEANIEEIHAARRLAFEQGMDSDALDERFREEHDLTANIPKLEKQLGKLLLRMEKWHRRAATRAQATTREANLGKLAQSADSLRDAIARARAVQTELVKARVLLFLRAKRAQQLGLFRGKARKQVEHPGLRGGKWWLGPHGDVRYGLPPLIPAGRLPIEKPHGEVMHFRSGASDVTTMAAYAAAGVPIGIDVQIISGPAQQQLARYVQQGGQAFADSGAFSAFKAWKKGKRKTQITREELDRALTRYEHMVAMSLDSPSIRADPALARSVAARWHLSAPDQLGEQAWGLAEIEHFAPRLKALMDKGISLIVPLQRGDLSLAEYHSRVLHMLGGRTFVSAIPSNEEAVPLAEAVEFAKQVQPGSMHLLGLGEPHITEARRRAIQAVSPETVVTSDSCRLTAIVGTGRPHTEAVRAEQARVLGQLSKEAKKRRLLFDVEKHAGKVGPPIRARMLAVLEGWKPPAGWTPAAA